jgi:hypothetical protein
MARVNEMWEALNRGENPLAEATLNDLASLFKGWFAGLPVPIVPASEVPRLRAVGDGDRNFVDFVATPPPLHGVVLTYLVGFLHRMSLAAEVIKMPAQNLAICFGPNVISSDGVGAMEFARHAELSSDFLVDLIDKLDTRSLFPQPIAP